MPKQRAREDVISAIGELKTELHETVSACAFSEDAAFPDSAEDLNEVYGRPRHGMASARGATR